MLGYDKKNNKALSGERRKSFEHSHGELIELPGQGRQKGQFGWGSGLGRGYISTAHYESCSLLNSWKDMGVGMDTGRLRRMPCSGLEHDKVREGEVENTGSSRRSLRSWPEQLGIGSTNLSTGGEEGMGEQTQEESSPNYSSYLLP